MESLSEGIGILAARNRHSRRVDESFGLDVSQFVLYLCKRMHVQLPDRDLAYLPEDHPAFAAYVRDLNWAQQFALHNRNEMMDRVLTEVSFAVHGADGHQPDLELQRINSHHNFTQKERHFGHNVWVTRKGAIMARRDDWAMIPGRSLETDGRSRRRRDGWFAKDHGAATTKWSGSSQERHSPAVVNRAARARRVHLFSVRAGKR